MWSKRVAELKRSELTLRDFAAEIGVKAPTLAWWKWRLGREARESASITTRRSTPQKARPTFVEVSTRIASRDVGIELIVSDVTIRIGSDFDDEALTRVVRAVRRA